jgi:hypothetical protein
MKMNQENDPEALEGISDSHKSTEKYEKLYKEIQAMKMSVLHSFMALAQNQGLSDATALKLSQFVLKAIEMQLRILRERPDVAEGPDMSESVELIWEHMLNVSELKAILTRPQVRAQMLEGLKKDCDERD